MKVCTIVSAGVVFQAGGCMLDTSELVATFASSVITRLVSDVVFTAFGVGGP